MTRHLDLNPLTGTREQTTLEQDLERALRCPCRMDDEWHYQVRQLVAIVTTETIRSEATQLVHSENADDFCDVQKSRTERS